MNIISNKKEELDFDNNIFVLNTLNSTIKEDTNGLDDNFTQENCDMLTKYSEEINQIANEAFGEAKKLSDTIKNTNRLIAIHSKSVKPLKFISGLFWIAGGILAGASLTILVALPFIGSGFGGGGKNSPSDDFCEFITPAYKSIGGMFQKGAESFVIVFGNFDKKQKNVNMAQIKLKEILDKLNENEKICNLKDMKTLLSNKTKTLGKHFVQMHEICDKNKTNLLCKVLLDQFSSSQYNAKIKQIYKIKLDMLNFEKTVERIQSFNQPIPILKMT